MQRPSTTVTARSHHRILVVLAAAWMMTALAIGSASLDSTPSANVATEPATVNAVAQP